MVSDTPMRTTTETIIKREYSGAAPKDEVTRTITEPFIAPSPEPPFVVKEDLKDRPTRRFWWLVWSFGLIVATEAFLLLAGLRL